MTPELKTACEVIFQEHKVSSQPIKWNSETFRGRISLGLSDLAKDTLVKKNIIILPNKSKKILTQLNPDVAAASSFEEAEDIIKNKKQGLNGYSPDISGSQPSKQTLNKDLAATNGTQKANGVSNGQVIDHNSNQTAKQDSNQTAKQDSNGRVKDNHGGYTAYRVSAPFVSQPQHLSPQVSMTDTAEVHVPGNKWYLKPLFYYIVWPLFALMAGALISYFLDFAYTELFLTHR